MYMVYTDTIQQKVFEFTAKRHGIALLWVEASNLWSNILTLWYDLYLFGVIV